MNQLFVMYLRVLAVVLYVQYIGSQFYDPTAEGLAGSVYRVLDPLLVLGMVIVVFSPTSANAPSMPALMPALPESIWKPTAFSTAASL